MKSVLTKNVLTYFLSGLYSDWADTVWSERLSWVQWNRITGGCYSGGQPQLYIWWLDLLLY